MKLNNPMSEIDLQEINRSLATIRESIQSFAKAIAEIITPFLDAFLSAYRCLYDEYVLEGAIYGEDQDGYHRWLMEKFEISNEETAHGR